MYEDMTWFEYRICLLDACTTPMQDDVLLVGANFSKKEVTTMKTIKDSQKQVKPSDISRVSCDNKICKYCAKVKEWHDGTYTCYGQQVNPNHWCQQWEQA